MTTKCPSMNATVSNQTGYNLIINRFVIPTELSLGFVLQLLNMVVLHGNRIRSLSYIAYMKTLCFNYLMAVTFLIPNILEKNGVVGPLNYYRVFYAAHCSHYVINFFLFSANAIIVAMAAEPLRAMLWPLQLLKDGPYRSIYILISIHLLIGTALIPITCIKRVVVHPFEKYSYCWQKVRARWVTDLTNTVATVFELALLLAVVLIYVALLIKFHMYASENRKSVRAGVRTQSGRMSSKNKKATVMCMASVAAYLLSNSVSALKETFKVLKLDADMPLFMSVANAALLTNFSLVFLLQYVASDQFRAQLHGLVCGRTLFIQEVTTTGAPSTPSLQLRQGNRALSAAPDAQSIRRKLLRRNSRNLQ